MVKKKLLSRKKFEKFLAGLPKGECTFCDYKKYQIVLQESKNWVWIATLAPYWPYHTMLVPKRHFKSLWDANEVETKEFMKLIKITTEIYRKKKLYRKDRSLIKQYVFFWRLRDNLFDHISKNISTDHFHFHIAPDRDRSWNPIIDPKAHLWDVQKFKRK